MAIMRTNRLTSKTTPPQKTQNTKGVTVSNKERRVIPATELEAQDAVYKRYQQDTEAYNEKMKRYNTLTKGASGGRDYRPFFGSESNTRRLTPEEAVEFNKRERSEQGEYLHNPGDLFIETKNINVPKGAYKKISNEKGKTYQGAINAYLSDYVKPTAPKSAEKADWSKVELNKIPTKKATISAPKGKLRDMKTQEFGEFEAPSMDTKVKTKRALTGGGDKGLVRAKNTGGSLKTGKRVVLGSEKTVGSRAYNKEKKQFEAFANQLPTGGRLSDDQWSPEIGRMKADAKGLAKEYRKEGNREGVKMMRAEAKQLGKAAKFSDKMYDRGGGDYFTRDMIQEYRSSSSNPANQNTIERQQKLIDSRK